ncbi:peptidase family protein [Proteiniborus sp. DW1]|uniref:M28 family metallopeptidase n=1 Tax=Proteiniborus sp. DW1 TaxID=1889883 RepID=UPI00092E1C7F|nr:M28 family peptidase [Proteiniborus sp. DW1]SCG82410.1 peptidase family protein [Proteiniborus sp. DW1]
MRTNRKLTFMISTVLIVSLFLTGCATFGKVNNSELIQNTAFENIREKDLDSKNIMKIIEELTSEKYKGRLAGTKGNELATHYIANYFKKIKLDYPGVLDTYLQHFDHNVRFTYSAPKLQILNEKGEVEKDFEYIKEFSVNTGVPSLSIKGELKGKGIVVDNTENIMKDIESYDGKVLLVPRNILASEGNRKLINKVLSGNSKIGGMIIEVDIDNPNHMYGSFVVGPNAQPTAKFEEGQPLLFNCNVTVFNELVKASNAGLEISMKADYAIENVTSANVIGYIEGKDKVLKEEFIIIGAHFDHAGDNKNGTYNPGALDNASGTAVMMEIARILKEGNYKPKKSILFIAFNGEEEGIYGSYHYVNNPIYPLNKDRTVMINLDMVGSKTEMPLTLLSFDSTNIKLREEFYRYSKALKIDCVQDAGQGSDHYPFGTKGIDVLCLINMDLKNGYHTPEDTIDKVDEKRITEITKLVLYYIDKNAF